MKKNRKTTWIIIGIVVAVALLVVLLTIPNRSSLELNTAIVQQDTVRTTIMATGYVQPVEEVEVGTQVSGVIEKIYVDYNSHVVKGQLLAELDKSTLTERLNQAKASVSSAESDMQYAQQNFDRTKLLLDSKAATQVAYEEALNRLNQAKNTYQTAKADLNQAEVNLSYAEIYSPINGVVLSRSVNTGQTVAASFSTPTLFTIAEDLTKMQVEVDVDEADIGELKVGQTATFTVDAYDGYIFHGKVNQIRIQPTVTNNVVTYTVIVDAPNPDQKLYPGMTASVTIDVQAEGGLTVPLEAFTFRVTPENAKKYNLPIIQPNNVDGNRHTVWLKEDDGITPREVEVGTDDGISVVVNSGLQEGDEVVLSVQKVARKDKKAANNPLMPSPPGGRRR